MSDDGFNTQAALALDNRRDPLAQSQIEDFDWQELFRRTDGDDAQPDELARMGQAVGEILRFLLQDWNHVEYETRIARRLIAFAWTVNPEFFGGVSLSELARQLEIPNTERLSVHSAEVRRRFKIQNRFQSHSRLKEVSDAA